LSTDIDWQNRDHTGKMIPQNTRTQMYRMRKWQRRARVNGSRERNLSTALAEMDRMGSRLGLPKATREAASVLYRRTLEANMIRGRSIEGVVAACIYLGCRQCGVPRTLNEISRAARCGRKEIGRVQRHILRELKINMPIPKAVDYIPRFSSDLGLDSATEAIATNICRELEERELDSGRGPTGLAASVLYIASVMNETRRTQKEVAQVSGVTEVTIRNRYKEIILHLGLDVVV
jgi:transcription initiation factor TFIIB